MISDTPRELPAAVVDIRCGHCKTPLTVREDREHYCERCMLAYGDDPFDESPATRTADVCGWTPGLPVGNDGRITVQYPCDLGAGHLSSHRYAEQHIEKKGAGWCAGASAS